MFSRYACLLLLCLAASAAEAQEGETKQEFVPQRGEFPPPDVGRYLAGELVALDHVNRCGALRLMGDGVDDRYHRAESHRFAMLPYGTIRYHGAPAEMRDLPIGTVLHGYFVLPPAGDTLIAPPNKQAQKYVPKYTHALSIEDSFSFYQRQGQAWKILKVDAAGGKLQVVSTGSTAKDGLSGERTFEFDASTRVWQGRQIAGTAELAADQIVQLNFTWAPDWKNGQLHVSNVWIGEESRQVAAEVQRQTHIRHQRTRWLPGWIDHVEHQGDGRGIVTVTLFAGQDPSLYEAARGQARPGGGASIACAERTLLTWWQEHDAKNGAVLDYTDTPHPPTGSSGLQLRVQIRELLEGYRPGRIIRFRPNGFPNVKLPPEERVKGIEERIPEPFVP